MQGPANRRCADWGLDNTGAAESRFDEVRERAAVRLQGHLAGGFGLRAHMFPTTVVRPFYEGLPDQPLDADEEDVALARAAATRAGHAPFRGALGEALRESALALGISLHRGGAALADLACGDCAWRAGSGLCRAADRRIFVAADEQGCARHETALDCLRCGACCRSGYDAVPAGPRARVVLRHPALVVARDGGFDLGRKTVGDEDRCVALDGPVAGPYACAIYADRPPACADLPVGASACLHARRRVGLSLG